MSSTGNGENSKKTKSGKPKTNEDILLGFQKLRSEQRFLSNKLGELEIELHEHRMVIEALKDMDSERKCFRMIGGILCERTVKDVVPVLKTNEENLVKVVDTLNNQLIAKGTEINKYKDENNVKFKHIDELSQTNENESKSNTESSSSSGIAAGGGSGGGVLVP